MLHYGISKIKRDQHDLITHVLIHKFENHKYSRGFVCTIERGILLLRGNLCYTIQKINGEWKSSYQILEIGGRLSTISNTDTPHFLSHLPKLN